MNYDNIIHMQEFYEIDVKEVMHSRVWDLPLVKESDSIKIVLLVLTSRGYVWVVENMDDMKLVGVITEHDALHIFDEFSEDMKAGDVAEKNIIFCRKDEKVKEVIEKIRKYNVRRLPVVEDGRIIGEVTLRLLIEKFYSLIC